MSTLDTGAPAQTLAARRVGVCRLAAPLFAAVLFASALLLFAVQPMFTKMVLPKLGGSPAVWSTAMVAFQALLFAGYLYAHVLSRALAPGRAALAHLLLLTGVATTLPLGIAAGFEAPNVATHRWPRSIPAEPGSQVRRVSRRISHDWKMGPRRGCRRHPSRTSRT